MPVYLTLCVVQVKKNWQFRKKRVSHREELFFYWNKSERHGSEEMNEPTESNFSGRLNERPGAHQVLTRPFSGWGPLLGRPRLPSLSNIFAFFSLLLFYVSSRFLSAVCIGRRTLCGMQWSPRAFGRRSITLQVTHTHTQDGRAGRREMDLRSSCTRTISSSSSTCFKKI